VINLLNRNKMSDVGSEDFDEEQGPNLGVYEGERNEKEERHGYGKATLPNGDKYEGYYENGKRNGQGTYKFKNGARYIGQYIKGKKHGEGVMYYPDGSKYEGQWVDDMRHGNGTYTYVNGDVYSGEWTTNNRQGQGVYTYAETGTKYVGTWVNGRREGAGELIHSNHKFVGQFSFDVPKGKGKYIFDIGCEQLGEYMTIEQPRPDDAEEDAPPILVPKWKAGRVQPIQLADPNADAFNELGNPPTGTENTLQSAAADSQEA